MKIEKLDEWGYKGMKCIVRYNDQFEHGIYLGYVRVPREIKSKVITEVDELDVFGGITYGGAGERLGEDEGYWIGWDSEHGLISRNGLGDWDLEDAKKETENLVDEILDLYPSVVKEIINLKKKQNDLDRTRGD